ncbi:hypothetical protein, partial [Streptomyces sp. NPDC052225]|uniref:hypothetical protein n=1 Tax=Streptomyces sp. NPDC052225 TaxID=3154949 RepID=UPI00342683C1
MAEAPAAPAAEPGPTPEEAEPTAATDSGPSVSEDPVPSVAEDPAASVAEDPEVAARRREFAALMGEFRRTAVLVPLGGPEEPGGEQAMLTADFNGIRFILAFSDEQALARYAKARGEYAREWTYQTVLGAKL